MPRADSATVTDEPPSHISETGRFARHHVLWIVILWIMIFVPGMFRPGLLDDADSAHAEAAREMLTTHDWVTLHLDGIRYLEKAPLLYWGMASSFKVFGVHDWSARLPLMLGVLALLLAVQRIGRRIYGEYGGFISAAVLATAIGPFLFTRILIPDILVALWLTMGMMFFLEGMEQSAPSRLVCWGFAATCALNVLTKGLIGIVFPIAIVLAFAFFANDFKRLLRMRLLSSALIFLAIAAPWHVLAGLRNPTQGSVRGFVWFYFVNEHFLRYLNERIPHDYGTVPLWLFWTLMLVWLFPWSSFLLQAVKQVPHRLQTLESEMSLRTRFNLLAGVWAAVVLLFFSFSTRQEYYVLPALPALALLIGGWLAREDESEANSGLRRTGKISSAALLAVCAAVFVVATAALILSKPSDGRDLIEVLSSKPSASGEYELSMGHLSDLTPQAMGYFRGPLALFACGLLLGAGFNLYWRRRGATRNGNLILAVGMVSVLYAVQTALVIFSPVISSKPLARAIKQAGFTPQDIVEINGEYESGSTLNFYLGHEVRILNGHSANLWYGSLFPDAPKIFDDDASFAKLWVGQQRVFLLSPRDDIPKIVEKGQLIAASGGKVVLSNR
jgi:4-amino-4-deoxy-L-arabinose transferase-like glycosyltransferase